ncbi:hypothetical protein DFJ58DRAFT_611577, partial [Suillus subalutaceus]|uniref:uncharacterized protein n=1 Tax=Suillus subalutaceus TaxID=48586 RepID=UPI001B882704
WVFHDNICAHEMSVVSMSSVLPRTPAEINGLLSIVFVGPGKFKPDQLVLFFECVGHTWVFLVWSKDHHRFYLKIYIERENV